MTNSLDVVVGQSFSTASPVAVEMNFDSTIAVVLVSDSRAGEPKPPETLGTRISDALGSLDVLAIDILFVNGAMAWLVVGFAGNVVRV